MKTGYDRGSSLLSAEVRKAYEQGIDDYHMTPLRSCALQKGFGKISDGDTVIFGCRRGEREIELTEMFTDPDFDNVTLKHIHDLEFVLLTQYHEKFSHLPIAFKPEHVPFPLAEVLSENGKTQCHIAESEKFAHVTFFFNGGENKPFPGETDVCIPSPRGVPFQEIPELSLPEVSAKACEAVGRYDFIVVNFANGDVIGHTPDSQAKFTACKILSEQLEKVTRHAIALGYVVAVTADHGNIEKLYNKEGKPHVAHTTNKVAFMLIDGKNPQAKISLRDGSLKDVAPTILSVMGLDQPSAMDGACLCADYPFGDDRKVLLVIMDGWGLGSHDRNDTICMSDTPYWDMLLQKCSSSTLEASGSFVGLEDGKPGNSEAGHINLGAGRCVIQDDLRIDNAMENGEFENNEVILESVRRSIRKGSALQLITYLSFNSSHGSMNYAVEICRMAKKLGQKKVFLHVIFDGRSTENGTAPALLDELEHKLDAIGAGYIVDGIGRGYVLDRDKNYENVKKAYDLFIGQEEVLKV
jgi:2,3-bisphosphoglycerate-independent phosphoglycerate mutase